MADFLGFVEPGSERYQATEAIVAAESYASVDAVHTDVDIVPVLEIAVHEALPLGLTLLCKVDVMAAFRLLSREGIPPCPLRSRSTTFYDTSLCSESTER